MTGLDPLPTRARATATTPSSTTLRVGAVEGLSDLLAAAGLCRQELLRYQGLNPLLFDDPENRYTFRQHLELLEAAAAALDDPALGLHLGQRQSIRTFGLLGHAIETAPSLRAQLDTVARYAGLQQDGVSVNLQVEDGIATLAYAVIDPAVMLYRLDAEHTTALWLTQWRAQIPQPSWRPISVHFEHPRSPADRTLRHLCDCPVYYNEPFHGLRFPAALLDTPLATGDAGLHALLRRYADDCLAKRRDPITIAGRVRRLIASSLGSGPVTIGWVADRMAMTPRTLQRRLSDEGLQFSDVIDAARRDLSVQYLADPSISLTHAALLVGYSDQPAFHRAFRRWFNQTPLDYQRRARAA